MLAAELRKLRTRTPIIATGLLLIPIVVFGAMMVHDSPTRFPPYQYLRVLFITIVPTATAIYAVCLGAWWGGLEFRNGVWQTIVAREPRRHRLLLTKAIVLLAVSTTATSAAFWLAYAAVQLALSVHGVTIYQPLPLIGDFYLSTLIWQAALVFIGAAIAAISRSTTIGVVAGLLIFFLGLMVAGIGAIAPFNLIDALSNVTNLLLGGTGAGFGGTAATPLAPWNALLTSIAYPLLLGLAAAYLFRRRDIAER